MEMELAIFFLTEMNETEFHLMEFHFCFHLQTMLEEILQAV